MRKPAAVLALCACISAVYLAYLPHALPVLDDWLWLQSFHQARSGVLAFLVRVIDNTWMVHFRVYWASFVAVFALSFAAGFTAWPYFLLDWTAHLLTAVLLWRLVLLISGDQQTAFSAAAIYAVFPAANNVLFWPVNSCFYYLQSLLFLAWLCITWKKLATRGDWRWGWKDFALLLPVAFAGEQILLALVLLLPVTFWLFGPGHGSASRSFNGTYRVQICARTLRSQAAERHAFFRYWLSHAAALVALIAFYAFVVNRVPVFEDFRSRYGAAGPWSLRPAIQGLFVAWGLVAGPLGWRAAWRPDALLILLAAVAALAVVGGLYLCRGTAGATRRGPTLLVWSAAGVMLTYLPVARLNTFEARYLYVPSMFLASGGAAERRCWPWPGGRCAPL